MKAMILAAGLGTRLRPLTDERPKALVEVAGRTLLEIAITRLEFFGIRDVIINVHHYADKIVDYLRVHKNFGMHIETSLEDVLLDTGGGLKKAGWFFLNDCATADEPFLLHNVDILSSIDLRRMVEAHNDRKALATLAVQRRDSSRLLIFDENQRLSGRRAGRDQEPEIVCPSANFQPRAFCGVHVISPRLLRMMREDGVFSIIDCYLRLAARGENILGFPADEYYWRDVGKLEQVQQAAADYEQKRFS